MLLFFALCLCFLAVLFNLYVIVAFIKSKGMYPPFIVSFGAHKKEVIAAVANFIAQNKNFKTVDLGCGCGSLLIPLAKRFPENSFVGYEWSLFPYLLAKWRTRNLRNVTIWRADFFKADLSAFDVALCYLGNGKVAKMIAQKLTEEMQADGLVISELFEINGLKERAVKTVRCFGVPVRIYLYYPVPDKM